MRGAQCAGLEDHLARGLATLRDLGHGRWAAQLRVRVSVALVTRAASSLSERGTRTDQPRSRK